MKTRCSRTPLRRRAAVAMLVCLLMPVFIGFAALTVDVGVIYNARADIQRAADAGAMAAAASLSSNEFVADPVAVATDAAVDIVESNPVMGKKVTIDRRVDIEFGRANYDTARNRYNFTETRVLPDAVRVQVRCTEGSPNGPIDLFFAPFFGKDVTEVAATATAAISPRDISLVVDTSGSMRFDSMMWYYRTKNVNIFDVWDELPGGSDSVASSWDEDELPEDPLQSAGPGWGFFKRMGWGDDLTENGYNLPNDPGLIRLRQNQTWNEWDLAGYLANQGYTVLEIMAILRQRDRNEEDDDVELEEEVDPFADDPRDLNYPNRVAVALGLAHWNSGMEGGLWERQAMASPIPGNGNWQVTADELDWQERILDRSEATSRAMWQEYVRFVNSHPYFRDYFGIKTLVEYLIHYRGSPAQTPEFADTPLQPMQAVKDAGGLMTELLEDLDTTDQLSLESYATRSRHEVNLTRDFRVVIERLNQLQPDGATNMGSGIGRAIAELTSPRARTASRKVIVLMTDGYANVDERGRSSNPRGKQYALDEAQRAVSLGMQIITVSVGQDSDQALMRRIATIGHGTHFHAEGSIEQYSDRLAEIFTQIGGRRSVELIE